MNKLVIGSLLAMCSLASAEPRVDLSSTDVTSAPAPARPDLYMSLDAAFGANTAVDWIYGAAGIDGGYRLTDTMWIRGRFDETARVGYGAINQGPMLVAPTSASSEALTGLEWRGCASRAACVAGGFDVGLRFGAHSGFTTVPRIGLDIGTEHLRFRPTLEANVAWLHGYDKELGGVLPALGIGLTTAVAYQW